MNLPLLVAVTLVPLLHSADLNLSSLRLAMYPDGPPRRVNPTTGNSQPVLLDFPLRFPVSSDSWVVIATEEMTNTAADSYFLVFAATLASTNSTFHMTSRTNLTDFISNYTEEPGNFWRLASEGSLVGPSPSIWIQLALTSTLYGTGARSARDVLYLKCVEGRVTLAADFPRQYSSFRLGEETYEAEHYRLSPEIEQGGSGLRVRKTMNNVTTDFHLR